MMLNRRTMILGATGAGLGFSRVAAETPQTTGGYAFGSSWRITTGAAVDLRDIRSTVEDIITRIDMSMSPFRKGSDLTRFNNSSAGGWQRMPRQFCHVASEALAIAKQTSGAFDPTIGPLVSKFGFGPIMGGMGSYTDISVREDAVQKTAPDLTLDLCGIAKGYALDQIVEALALAGIDNALVEVGGEVRTLGQHPTGRNWKVAISDPNSVLFRTSRVVDPGSYALATSGHSANGLLGAVSVSHLIDPHRGRPAPTTLASVSVLAPTALRADALATAICAVGLDAGVDLARRLNVAALFLPNDTVEQTETMTGEFSRHVLF